MSKKNLIAGQSGGPTAAINSSLYGVIREGFNRSEEIEHVYGMINGIQGFLDGRFMDMKELDNDTLEALRTTPGAYLGSCRFKLPDDLNDAIYPLLFQKFEEMNIGYFFYIGGNDSMDTVSKLSRYAAAHNIDVRIMGIPKTIDNDLILTDHTPGFGSAAKYVAASVCEIGLDASVYNTKSVTIIEIMGRHAGYLALYVGVAVGATAVLVPEHPYDFKVQVADNIRHARLNGKTNFMIVVAEGAASAVEVGRQIQEELALDPRVTILGHIQRGGSPTAKDRVMATRMGYEAVRVLAEGKTNRVICAKDDQIIDLDIDEGLAMKKTLNSEEFKVMTVMTGM